MWFVDYAQITVHAGDGGRGCAAFSQPPYTRTPYPDGGAGGDGGSVVIRADPNIATLLDFHFRHEFKAGRGRHGGGNRKTGKRGENCLIKIPLGTVIRDVSDGLTLRDAIRPGDEVIVARGGVGGVGNATADEARPGTPGEKRQLILELKLIADVGIVGAPNAGKSSFLARISTAKPKVGAYPFTTRYPVLGVVSVEERGTYVACDIPGLIEGAHEGRGLGMQFLRHIERTRLIVHLIDMAALDGRDPMETFRQVNNELASYSQSLKTRPQIVVANKMDLSEAREKLRQMESVLGDSKLGRELHIRIWPISCATGAGIAALRQAIWEALQDMPQESTKTR